MNVHRIEITKNLNQVPICTLKVTGIDEVNVGQTITIIAVASGINFPTFSGIITEIQKETYNRGTIILGDSVLSEDRDDETITASVVWFEPKLDGNCISAELKYGSSPIRFLNFSDAQREINFANASKLQILQQYSEEYGKYFNANGIDDLINGSLFTFSQIGNYRITERKKTKLGDTEAPSSVRVSYLKQYPLIQQTTENESEYVQLSNWIGDSYMANINTTIQKINDVEIYRKSNYSPVRGGTIYEELTKTVAQNGEGYTVRTKQTTYYNQIKSGILHNITLGSHYWSFDILAHYNNDEGKWEDYITIVSGGFIYDGQKYEWSDTNLTLDQTDKNGDTLEEGEAYYSGIYLNYLSGQIYFAKGEKDTYPSTLTIASYLQSWQLATVRVEYTGGASEINTANIEIDWQGFPWGGLDDPHYKYFETVEQCDSALRVYERAYTVKDDDKTIYYKRETWGEASYDMIERQEDKNGNLVTINQINRGYSSMPTAAAPRAEIVSEEGYAQYGGSDKIIDVSSSFLSDGGKAGDYAQRLYKKGGSQLQAVEKNDGWIQFLKLVPTAEPGQKYSNPLIFEGLLSIEQVTHTIDFDTATAITEISGSIE
jgi:hypothetical protein